ncbi:MAG: hypothetical protein ACI8Y4_002359 [Candidatus Poriferisodalaceae bacterium]|jgi:hypothetical protein
MSVMQRVMAAAFALMLAGAIAVGVTTTSSTIGIGDALAPAAEILASESFDDAAHRSTLTGAGGIAFVRPGGMDAHPFGIVLADSGNDRVVLINEVGAVLDSWGSTGTAPGQFLEPTDVAVLAGGVIVVADSDNDRLQLVSGQTFTVIGSRGTGAGQFVRPVAVAALADGGFWVVDEGNDRIQRFTAAGQHIATVTGLTAPSGISVAADGSMLVTERLAHRVRTVTAAGALGGTVGSLGDGVSQLSAPGDVAAGANGTAYVVDTGNGRVRSLGTEATMRPVVGPPSGFVSPTSALLATLAGVPTLVISDAGTHQLHFFDSLSLDSIESVPPPVPTPGGPILAVCSGGYYLAEADGDVHVFGDALALPGSEAPSATVDIQTTPTGCGYWQVRADGSVRAAGDAADFGNFDVSELMAGEQVSSVSTTSTGQGLWGFTGRGRVLTLGDASLIPDAAGRTGLLDLDLQGGIVDSVPTPSGMGFYMLGADGGVFTFGDAAFSGSVPGLDLGALNAPVVGLVPDPDGDGYWAVAGDGGVFSFDAAFRGSFPGLRLGSLNEPVVGMVAYGDGYLQVASDGGVFVFSNLAFLGSLGAEPPNTPIVAISPLP